MRNYYYSKPSVLQVKARLLWQEKVLIIVQQS